MQTLIAAVLTLVVSAGIAGGAATPPVPPFAVVGVHASQSAAVPGETMTLALQFRMDDGWHIYHEDPGDSGVPPSVRWTVPTGWSVSQLRYPKFERLQTTAGWNNVYHGIASFLVDLTIPADAPTGNDVTLRASVEWLVCDADQCIPESQAVELVLRVDSVAEPLNQQLFESWIPAEGSAGDR